jgi:hypothetical protein
MLIRAFRRKSRREMFRPLFASAIGRLCCERIKHYGTIAAPSLRDAGRWIDDAHREGRRCIVHSDELRANFLSWNRRYCCCGISRTEIIPRFSISWTPVKVGAHLSGQINDCRTSFTSQINFQKVKNLVTT